MCKKSINDSMLVQKDVLSFWQKSGNFSKISLFSQTSDPKIALHEFKMLYHCFKSKNKHPDAIKTYLRPKAIMPLINARLWPREPG